LLEKGELDSAIQVSRSALLLRPSDADCHTTLAIALEEKGNPAEAIQYYQKALELAPSSVPTLTNLAWLLATSPEASLRNGLKAVQLAKQADRLVGGTNTIALRTLAAAYAENGEFANAIKTARSAMQLARMHGEDTMIMDLDQQIALYQLGMPYRDTVK
jgi:Flp pilus assembly protein TadD